VTAERERIVRLETAIVVGVVGLIAWIREMFRGRDRALDIFRVDTHEHFETVNGNNANVTGILGRTVDREQYLRDQAQGRAEVGLAKTEAGKGRQTNLSIVVSVCAVIVALVIGIAGIAVVTLS
jgi:hypothetical protein